MSLTVELNGLPSELAAEAAHVLACSPFVQESLARDSTALADLMRSTALQMPRTKGWASCWPEGKKPEFTAPECDLQAWLRRWRRREMLRIAWRDLTGRASLEETLSDLSSFADEAIRFATCCATESLVQRYGVAKDDQGNAMPLVVVAMGKLGGGELNFSSDIDLIFLFKAYGETTHSTPLSLNEYFIRLGQSIIRLLAAPTVDGFVFRVDMRLRPFGDSGPLACGFSAFEDYLLEHGRDWERYAWIKARPVTGLEDYTTLYLEAVRPFVYRRYLDFGVFASLREMKQLIEKQIARRDLIGHIKLGSGGIREIEFIVQALQLIRGGQDRRLQNPCLLEILPLLSTLRLLQPQVAQDLEAAYRYLRTLENRLQMLRDTQTHTLPEDVDSQQRLARAMGEKSWPAVLKELDVHMTLVQREFNALIFSTLEDSDNSALGNTDASLKAIWDETLDLVGLRNLLSSHSFTQIPELAQLLADFRASSMIRRFDTVTLRRLHQLVPELLTTLALDDDHLVITRRMLRVLEAIGSRSAYFSLLNENPVARERFIAVCRGGDFLVAQLAEHPLLLDELLDERTFTAPPSRDELLADLKDRLARVDANDEERLVETLSQFKRAAIFRVAIADLSGRWPLMKVSDYLTYLAELIIEQAMAQAMTQMAVQFGMPTCIAEDDSVSRPVKVCAVGYGKLGGIELGYGSDLDLVFLHDSNGTAQETLCDKPIDNQIFFIRLAQRIVHILTVQSSAGRLYEVDVRLRPSGKGGMLITQIDAFELYQSTEAWTWEHQALLHARAVAGEPTLCERFESIRMNTLTRYVKRDSLKVEVCNMRERMRQELSRAKHGEFDMKQDSGGIADIEFLAQYWSLKYALEYPAVVMFSDTIRQLETLASGDLLPQETVDVLTKAYRAYRARGHHRSLRDESTVVPETEFKHERAGVTAAWNKSFGFIV